MREPKGLSLPSSAEKVENASTDVSPDKPVTTHAPISHPANGDDISPNDLLEVISQEWKQEIDRIVSLGLNGYKRRKEQRTECLV